MDFARSQEWIFGRRIQGKNSEKHGTRWVTKALAYACIVVNIIKKAWLRKRGRETKKSREFEPQTPGRRKTGLELASEGRIKPTRGRARLYQASIRAKAEPPVSSRRKDAKKTDASGGRKRKEGLQVGKESQGRPTKYFRHLSVST